MAGGGVLLSIEGLVRALGLVAVNFGAAEESRLVCLSVLLFVFLLLIELSLRLLMFTGLLLEYVEVLKRLSLHGSLLVAEGPRHQGVPPLLFRGQRPLCLLLGSLKPLLNVVLEVLRGAEARMSRGGAWLRGRRWGLLLWGSLLLGGLGSGGCRLPFVFIEIYLDLR